MNSEALRRFWTDFERLTQNGHRPAILSAADFSEPVFAPSDGVDLMGSFFPAGDLSINIGGQLRNDARLLSPPKTHSDYSAFVDELMLANDADTITFTRDYCLKHSPQLAHRIRRFVHEYVHTYGIPNPGVNAVFIGGRYRATWIGLHNDFCNTFLVPAVGRKKMLLWPEPYLQEAPLIKEPSLNGICYGHVELDAYREAAITLEVRPGEVLFIPAGWWHYNDLPTPELTMGLSIGIFDNSGVGDLVHRAISAAVGLDEQNRSSESLLPVSGGVLAPDLSEVGVDARADRILERSRYFLRLQALLASSCNGVLGCRPYRKPPENIETRRLHGSAHSPVYLIPDRKHCLLIAAGAMRRFSDSAEMRGLVDQVNSHAEFLAATLWSQSGSLIANEINAVISWLYALGCLEVECS